MQRSSKTGKYTLHDPIKRKRKQEIALPLRRPVLKSALYEEEESAIAFDLR